MLLLLIGHAGHGADPHHDAPAYHDRDPGMPGVLAAGLSHRHRVSCCCLSFPGSGVPSALSGWLALAFLGLSSGLAHCVFARGYALAPVSALAPYEYTDAAVGRAWSGFLLFGDLPSWNTLVGAVVVAASGTYNVYRERVRRAEERAAG